ncbi:MAG: hypothetical protein WCG13_00025 [Burkholderiales bacterium]
MSIINSLLENGTNHNIEVIDGHLCLFDSIDRNQVKRVKLAVVHIEEILEARQKFKHRGLKRAQAFRNIVESRVADWREINKPHHFCATFMNAVMSDRRQYSAVVREGFESFRKAYTRYWEADSDSIERTPFDEQPSEDQLRRLHARLVERLTFYHLKVDCESV